MTLFAPPSLAGLCYLVWDSGYSFAVRRRAVQQSTATYLAGLTTLLGAYRAQSLLVFPHFDALGTTSLKQTVEVLGEPLKVRHSRHTGSWEQTWEQTERVFGA